MIPITVHKKAALIPVIVLLVALAAVAEPSGGDSTPAVNKPDVANQPVNFDELRRKIIFGKAGLAEVRTALSDTDTGRLANTLHALYSMRWHRGVNNLLHDMWELDKQEYPELSWEQISEAPTRIALASTLGRIYYGENRKYMEYIRSHKNDDHEFHRAQVVIALGFNGDPDDVGYIKSMADGGNHYVAQSAITALSLMNRKAASEAMIDLWKKHRGTSRGDLILELLRKAYNLVPTTEKTDKQPDS